MNIIKQQIQILINSKILNSFRSFFSVGDLAVGGRREVSGLQIYFKEIKASHKFEQGTKIWKTMAKVIPIKTLFGVKIPCTRFNIVQYIVYNKSLADPVFQERDLMCHFYSNYN